MIRLSAVGRVTDVRESGDDVYLYVNSNFWNVDTASRDNVTVVFCTKANGFTRNLAGKSVYCEGTDIRTVKGNDGNILVVVMQARVESA